MLNQKQNGIGEQITATITLEELYAMQKEVAAVRVPGRINELMDDILCELRRKGIHVSDRKFLSYYPIAQAKAWLNGHGTVEPADMLVLKFYLWTKPEEITTVEQDLRAVLYQSGAEKIERDSANCN
jgi:MoxR-like ATPase